VLRVVVASVVVGCGAFGSVYSSSGVNDTTTEWLELLAGQYAITYTASDHFPWLGCTFGVAVARQPEDPMAPGVTVLPANEVRVFPEGRESGTIPVSIAAADTYYLWITGTCDWSIDLSRR
jgi:hypothetical protein